MQNMSLVINVNFLSQIYIYIQIQVLAFTKSLIYAQHLIIVGAFEWGNQICDASTNALYRQQEETGKITEISECFGYSQT